MIRIEVGAVIILTVQDDTPEDTPEDIVLDAEQRLNAIGILSRIGAASIGLRVHTKGIISTSGSEEVTDEDIT